MKKSLLLSIGFVLLTVPQITFAWGNAGHECVTEIALQHNPSLSNKVVAILKKLPSSKDWKALSKTKISGFHPVDKGDPAGWVKALRYNPAKSATFPDWARDYTGYKPADYDKWHYYDLDFADADSGKYVLHPNALEKLPPLENDLRTKTGGARAWALVWVLHIVGDLHQPLHCCSRAIQGSNDGDHGGNSVTYKSTELHSWWDHLPDQMTKNNPGEYAAKLLVQFNALDATQRQAIESKASDLNIDHWIHEGRDAIVQIKYPADHPATFSYSTEARKIVDQQLLLGGLRLEKVLEASLP